MTICLATAFHRNTMTNTEGGTDDEEFRVAAVKDRVDVTMQVWMGLTAGCAKCHSHKFDPLSQKEYYQLTAFFNQTADNDQPSEAPTMPSPTPLFSAEISRIDAEILKLRGRFAKPTSELAAAQAAWETEFAAPQSWETISPTDVKSESGASIQRLADGSVLIAGQFRESGRDYNRRKAKDD